jgi:hypothetical protein
VPRCRATHRRPMSRRRKSFRTKTSSPRQADLFSPRATRSYESDATKQIDQLFRTLSKLTLPMASDPPQPETFTPLSLLGEAFVKVGREHDDPQLEAAGLLLLGRKPH